MKPADYLTYYATKFDTVEVDSTFYRTPSVATVNGWERKTPAGFLLAVKIPRTITHEKIFQNCDEDLKQFLETMDLMGAKLGPLLFQFGYFNKSAFKSGKEFLARLEPFLKKLPKGYKFALEIRNKTWLSAEFFDLVEISRQLAPLNKLQDCAAEAVVDQVPFGNKIFGTTKGPADPVGTTLDTAEKLSSNKVPARLVWGLNKAGLPVLSETAENFLTKVVSILSPYAEKLSVLGWAWAGGKGVYDTTKCYNKPNNKPN
jgi:hypothetical protein